MKSNVNFKNKYVMRKECIEFQQCSTDFYITPQGHVFYDLGCRTNRVSHIFIAGTVILFDYQM